MGVLYMQKCILVSYWCIITVDDQDTTSIHPQISLMYLLKYL